MVLLVPVYGASIAGVNIECYLVGIGGRWVLCLVQVGGCELPGLAGLGEPAASSAVQAAHGMGELDQDGGGDGR